MGGTQYEAVSRRGLVAWDVGEMVDAGGGAGWVGRGGW